MKTHKIIHIILGKANPNRCNGINKVVHELSKEQAKMGHDVEIWGISDAPEDSLYIHGRQFATKVFHPRKLALDKALKNEINSTKDAFYHLHGGFIVENYLASKLIKANNSSYCLSGHGSYSSEAMKVSWLKKKIYFALFEKTLIQDSKFLHLLGESETEFINSLKLSNTNYELQNGQRISAAPSNQKKEELVFGYCGRINSYTKGLDILLEGFQTYLTNGGTGRLQLIGAGPELEELAAQIKKKNLTDSIEFTGPKYGEEKDSLFDQFSAFIHTSRYEGMPTVVLEAAEQAIPLILSKATNLGTYVRESNAGIILEENTAENLANALKVIESRFSNNSISEWSQNAREMIEQKFNWSTVAKQMTCRYFA
ncbi:glycosyltransferase [Chitinophagales bacterium]|nr:glycosyltransferase [Chitinophagales bacterium]